jgi:hypothetical protein
MTVVVRRERANWSMEVGRGPKVSAADPGSRYAPLVCWRGRWKAAR